MRDQEKYYSLSTNKQDVANITTSETFIHRSYEENRMKNLRVVFKKTDHQLFLEVPSHIKDFIAKIKCTVSVLNNVLTREKSVNMWSDIYSLKCQCDSATEILDSDLPRMKSHIHEFTDGGPGVSVSNNDAKIRFCEIVLITSAGIDFLRFHV